MLLTVAAAFTDAAKAIGSWYPPYLVIAGLAILAAYVGIWMMKKWGVLLFTAMFVVNNVVLFVAGQWNALALVLPLIFIAILFWKYKLMD